MSPLDIEEPAKRQDNRLTEESIMEPIHRHRLASARFCRATAVVIVASLLAISTGQAQNPAGAEQHPRHRIDKAVFSPEVLPDGRIIFRFRAPGAQKASLARDGAPRLPMAKDAEGTWSVTIGPLAPDLYSYNFIVDGVALADPSNCLQKPIITGGSESLVRVPGPPGLSWESRDVPHGVLHLHCYQSAVVGETREFWVYTPPGYDPAGPERYPLLYLLHGVMEDASAWRTAGRANLILDNLIAEQKATPMLVVMPLGYGFPDAPDRMAEQFAGATTQKKLLDVMTRCLLEEITPEVEKTYRVQKSVEGRAIAGASMGGSQALYIGLNHPDRFGWVGSFSGAFIMYAQPYEKEFPDLNKKVNERLHLLWLSCGTEDFLLKSNRGCQSWLKSKGVRFTAAEPAGGHTWPVWRRNLTEFASLIFK
jgi:enterochelin esterase family protein